MYIYHLLTLQPGQSHLNFWAVDQSQFTMMSFIKAEPVGAHYRLSQKLDAIALTLQLVSADDNFLYPQTSSSQLIIQFPPSRCPILRLRSTDCIINDLTSATAGSIGYLPSSSFSFLKFHEATPKRTVTSGSSSNPSRGTCLPRSRALIR